MANIFDGLKMPKFDFKMPNFSIDSIVPPINIDTLKLPKPTSTISTKIDDINKEAIIREMDKISNDLEWQRVEIEELNSKLKSLTNAIDTKKILLIFSLVTFIGVIIPFTLSIYSSHFDNVIGRVFLLLYLCISFFVSLLLIFLYIIYSYLSTTRKNNEMKNFHLYVGEDENKKNFRLCKTNKIIEVNNNNNDSQ